jgi:hypothetical protein
LRRRKVCSATGRTPQINTVVDPIRWYRLTVVVRSQRIGWKEHPLGYVEDYDEARTQQKVCFSSFPAGRSKRLSGWATAIRPTRLLKKVRLLTRPTPARQDALYPERGPSNSLYLSLGEWPRLPSTARIGRAQFHRARSASKEGTWPLPPHPSQAARCASKGIVPATPLPFQQPTLEEGHAGIRNRRVILIGDPAVVT